MKLKRAHITNFKGIKDLELDFTSPYDHQPRKMTALVGDNASGKTTVLQAIGLVLSLASRKTINPGVFAWPGFMADRLGTLGKTKVELDVAVTEDEKREIASVYVESGVCWSKEALGRIGDRTTASLVFENAKLTFVPHDDLRVFFQARQLAEEQQKIRVVPAETIRRLPGFFWFHQLRNVSNVTGNPQATWVSGKKELFSIFSTWWLEHLQGSKNGRDRASELEARLKGVFPDLSFAGVHPREGVISPGPDDYFFSLKRGDAIFSFEEMSSGEQAVFPLLFEFVRQDIGNSIVLIDELELHLHPPQQQALLGALPRIGPDCQFIFTTHSPYMSKAVPPEYLIRLPGGQPCL